MAYMRKLDAFLEFLANGEWHTISEMSEFLKLREEKVMMIAEFFSDYEFVQLDKAGKKVKIEKEMMDFLQKFR